MNVSYPYAFTSVLPRFIAPMNATAVRELPEGNVWTYEANLNGYRCLASTRDGEVTLWSCRGQFLNARFPEIVRACEKLPVETVIDGEIILVDESGKLASKMSHAPYAAASVEYYVYDILVLRGRSLLSARLEARRSQLCDTLYKVNYPVIRSQSFTARPADLIRAAKELHVDGIIAKHKGSAYEPGTRSRSWLKYKLPSQAMVTERRCRPVG